MTDSIDRQAAIEAVSEACLELRGVFGRCEDALKDLPSAERRGKWIYYQDIGGWHCSECCEQAPFWCISSTQNLSSFCPSCGARMEIEK